MSEKKPDGGTAYPLPYLSKNQDNGDLTYHESIGGMTLRDKFAGDALIGLLSAHAHPEGRYPMGKDKDAETIAVDAYKLADAMIAARDA